MKTETKKSPSLSFFLLLWVAYIGLHMALKAFTTTSYSGWLAFIVSIIFEVLVVGYSLWLWKYADEKAKRTFAYFALSFICIFFTSLIYMVFFNIIHLQHAKLSVALLSTYNIPYIGFLIFQLLAWASILVETKAEQKTNKAHFLYIPVVIIVLGSTFMFFLIYELKNWSGQTPIITFYTVSEGIFELASFIAALLCLAISQNRGIFYLALSYLLIIASDIIMNFGIFHQHFDVGSFIETFWFLGIMLRVYGLITIKRTSAYTTSPRNLVCEISSIRTQLAFWIFAISILSVSIFLGINYLLPTKVFF